MDPLATLIAGLALALLFLAGAAEKAAHFGNFRSIVGHYQLVPAPAVALVAGLLPGLEAAAAGAALWAAFGPTTEPLALPAALLFLYAAAMAINLMRGRSHIDCGCVGFGAARPSIGWPLVARNVVLGGIALLVALAPAAARPLGTADLISGIGALVALPLLYVAFEQFAAIRSLGKVAES
jgi:hypothetical protein